MRDNENAEFEEFAAAFGDGDSYQTDTETEEEVQAEETDGADAEETEEDTENQDASDEAEQPAEAVGNDDSQQEDLAAAAETFTLKVNKEERSYTREEVISLAQKGADYDRVKDKLGAHQQTIDALAEVAKTMGTEVPALLDTLMVKALMQKEGISEEVARERILRQKAEKENSALKQAAAQQTEAESGQQRAQREIADFRKSYPDVQLTKDLLKALMSDVQSGMSIKEAYERHETAQKDARIKELEAQLAAEKQNNKNRAASPGSQKDSGGRREKTDFDDFVSAFR